MKRIQFYSCNCGYGSDEFVDHGDSVSCPKCGDVRWVNFSHCKVMIDNEQKMETRKHNRKHGLTDIGDDWEFVHKHNQTITKNKETSLKEGFINKTVNAAEFLKRNKSVCKQISAEIRNTGKSATAKKISEVVV